MGILPMPHLFAPLISTSSVESRLRGENESEMSIRVLRQNCLHHLTMHIRQPEIPPLEPIRQPRMVDPQAVQNRRVEIMHVHRVLHDVVAVIIRLAVADPRLDSAAGHPERKASPMMIAAMVRGRQRTLAVN